MGPGEGARHGRQRPARVGGDSARTGRRRSTHRRHRQPVARWRHRSRATQGAVAAWSARHIAGRAQGRNPAGTCDDELDAVRRRSRAHAPARHIRCRHHRRRSHQWQATPRAISHRRQSPRRTRQGLRGHRGFADGCRQRRRRRVPHVRDPQRGRHSRGLRLHSRPLTARARRQRARHRRTSHQCSAPQVATFPTHRRPRGGCPWRWCGHCRSQHHRSTATEGHPDQRLGPVLGDARGHRNNRCVRQQPPRGVAVRLLVNGCHRHRLPRQLGGVGRAHRHHSTAGREGDSGDHRRNAGRRNGRGVRRPSAARTARDGHRRDRARERLRRHRHRLRTVRLRRRPRDLGNHAAELGCLHRRIGHRPALCRQGAHRQHPADLRHRTHRRQRLLGLRLRGNRRSCRPHSHHGVRLLHRTSRAHRPARVGTQHRQGGEEGRRRRQQDSPRCAPVWTQLGGRHDRHLPA